MSKHTPGPWRWFVNTKTRQAYLATPDRGRLYVMGFKRWGMTGAQPVFRNESCILQDASTLVQVDHNSEAVNGIEHPDAYLIAAAPDMLKELEFAVSLADDRAVWDYFDGGRRPSNAEADFIVRALPIIAKAKGEA